jgi:predicted Zn-dependent protease
MQPRVCPRSSRVRVAIGLAVLLAACATNPATGKREIMLVSEEQEVALGRQEDQRALAAYGEYPDPALQEYVSALGQKIAAHSERPDLPWTFRLADDAAVNAFAAPGGFIYVTRGILAHLESEAQLVMVLGHEVGHVTARHLARQITNQQMATLGLGIGMIAVPELQQYGSIGEAGLGLLFLKFSRDDEREADTLGLRYAVRLGYDPAEGARAFHMLDQMSRQSEGGRAPGWLSTHPDPGDRYQSLLEAIRSRGLEGERVDREAYLKRLDGLVFGDDPREGFFRDGTFYHPQMRFRFTLPEGFQGQNTKDAVLGRSPGGDAAVQLTLAREETPEAAARAFFAEVSAPDSRRRDVNGLAAVVGSFDTTSGSAAVRGLAAFVGYQKKVFRLVGYAGAGSWSRHRDALEAAVTSFAPLRESWALKVEPARMELVVPRRAMTLDEFQKQYASTVPLATVALINQLDVGDVLKAGRPAKRIVGGTAR